MESGRATSLTTVTFLLSLTLMVSCSTYDPCDDKSCGETCRICDPDDEDCVETTESKFCNSFEVCAPSTTPPICG